MVEYKPIEGRTDSSGRQMYQDPLGNIVTNRSVPELPTTYIPVGSNAPSVSTRGSESPVAAATRQAIQYGGQPSDYLPSTQSQPQVQQPMNEQQKQKISAAVRESGKNFYARDSSGSVTLFRTPQERDDFIERRNASINSQTQAENEIVSAGRVTVQGGQDYRPVSRQPQNFYVNPSTGGPLIPTPFFGSGNMQNIPASLQLRQDQTNIPQNQQSQTYYNNDINKDIKLFGQPFSVKEGLRRNLEIGENIRILNGLLEVQPQERNTIVSFGKQAGQAVMTIPKTVWDMASIGTAGITGYLLGDPNTQAAGKSTVEKISRNIAKPQAYQKQFVNPIVEMFQEDPAGAAGFVAGNIFLLGTGLKGGKSVTVPKAGTKLNPSLELMADAPVKPRLSTSVGGGEGVYNPATGLTRFSPNDPLVVFMREHRSGAVARTKISGLSAPDTGMTSLDKLRLKTRVPSPQDFITGRGEFRLQTEAVSPAPKRWAKTGARRVTQIPDEQIGGNFFGNMLDENTGRFAGKFRNQAGKPSVSISEVTREVVDTRPNAIKLLGEEPVFGSARTSFALRSMSRSGRNYGKARMRINIIDEMLPDQRTAFIREQASKRAPGKPSQYPKRAFESENVPRSPTELIDGQGTAPRPSARPVESSNPAQLLMEESAPPRPQPAVRGSQADVFRAVERAKARNRQLLEEMLYEPPAIGTGNVRRIFPSLALTYGGALASMTAQNKRPQRITLRPQLKQPEKIRQGGRQSFNPMALLFDDITTQDRKRKQTTIPLQRQTTPERTATRQTLPPPMINFFPEPPPPTVQRPGRIMPPFGGFWPNMDLGGVGPNTKKAIKTIQRRLPSPELLL